MPANSSKGPIGPQRTGSQRPLQPPQPQHPTQITSRPPILSRLPVPPSQAVRPATPPLKVMPRTPAPTTIPVRGAHPVSAPPVAAIKQAVGGMAVAPVTIATLNTASANEQIASEVSSLQSSLTDLQQRASFTDLVSEITNLDSNLSKCNELLESARAEGYCFQGDLESNLYQLSSRWEALRPQLIDTINQQSYTIQNQVAGVSPMIYNLNATLSSPTAATPILRNTQTYVNNVLSNLSQVECDIRDRFRDFATQGHSLNTRLTNIHWSMDQLSGAKFRLATGEDLVAAVPARWDKEGKEDPEGILFLSNKRLIFERKEKVATKKILFITTASELVQEVLIDQPVSGLKGVKPENKGLFGHKDYLAVDFTDARLGLVNFHINGQESNDWATRIETCRSGSIERERVTSATGITMAELTRPLNSADIVSIQSEVNQLQDDMILTAARQELGNLENEVNSLNRKINGLRSRGYEIEKDLEGDALILANQWERVKSNTGTTLETQTRLLSDQMNAIQHSLSTLVGMANNLVAARPVYLQLKSAIASAQAQASAAQSLVLAQYSQYAQEVDNLDAHIEWVSWMLDALSTASFRLLATEAGVAAVEAVFEYPGLEPENGILYLTDQRLLWEDRVGTYELKVNVPLQEIADVRKEVDTQNGQEYLIANLGSRGPVPTARFQLAMAVADDWIKMVGRARSGGYSRDRAVEVSEAELNRIRNAPQQCSKCGAALTTPILRGQTEITCDYCGFVIRI